jgi:hypothetical protein
VSAAAVSGVGLRSNVLAPHADAPELPTCCAPNRQGSTESTGWGTRRWLPQSGCTQSFMSPVERASQSLPLRRIRSLATTGCPARPIFGYLLLRHGRLPRHAWFCHRSQRLQNTGIGGRYAGSAGLAGCELERSLTRQVLLSCVRRIATIHSSHSRPSRSIVPRLIHVFRGTMTSCIQLSSEKAIHHATAHLASTRSASSALAVSTKMSGWVH